MEDIEKIMEKLSEEILRNLGEMGKTRDTVARKSQAEIVHLFCQSMTSLLDSEMAEISPFPFLDDDDDDDDY